MSADLVDHSVQPARGDDYGQAGAPRLERPGALSVPSGGPGGRRPGSGRGLARSPLPATPAHFAARVDFLKDEVFEICGALALGESVLAHLGRRDDAAHLAAVFDVVEGRLAEPLPISTTG